MSLREALGPRVAATAVCLGVALGACTDAGTPEEHRPPATTPQAPEHDGHDEADETAVEGNGSEAAEADDTGTGDGQRTPQDSAGESPTADPPTAEGDYPQDALVHQLGQASEPLPVRDADGSRAELRLTAERIELGRPEDLAAAYGEEAAGLKPAAVYLTVEHAGGGELRNPLIGRLASLGFTSRTEVASPATPQGNVDTPGGCTEPLEVAGGFAAGDRASLCVLLLVPEDAEPTHVGWSTAAGPPLVWQAAS